jgi:hypothetical protein
MNEVKIFSGIKKYYLNLYADVWHLIKINHKEGKNLYEYFSNVPEADKLFGKKRDELYLKLDKNNNKDDFDSMIKSLDAFDIRDRSEFYYYVKAFGNILYWAEKILLYQNDDTKDTYSIVNEDERTSVIYFNFDDAIVTVNFTESSINLPNKSADNPLNFMNDEDTFATFVEITITRNFGNNLVNNFKAILGSDEFGLTTDESWLLDLTENKICELIKYSLNDISNHIINNCCGLTNLNIEDLENGVTVWRPVARKA